MSCFSGGAEDMKESKLTDCLVVLLEGTTHTVKLKGQNKGQYLMDDVCNHLNIAEKDYFGLRFQDGSKTTHWVDVQKGVIKQLKRHGLNLSSVKFHFSVKFYATDPCKLKEEITRYQFFLQLKRDVLTGRIPIAFDSLVELCALVVQSELGDYDHTVHTAGYVSELRLAPQQSEDLEQAIAAAHHKLIGFHPSACEYMYLDKMKWQDMYGVDMHLVKGAGNTEYCIGLTPSGVAIYRHKAKVSIYYWPRITGITFKGKKFSLKVQDKIGSDTSYYFTFDTKESCKNLWKSCVEHHAFFRLSQADVEPNLINDFFHLGSKFRYSGRTEKELVASEPPRSPQPVRRTKSQRQERRQFKTADSLTKKQVNRPSSDTAVVASTLRYKPKPNTPDIVDGKIHNKRLPHGAVLTAQPLNSPTVNLQSSTYHHKPDLSADKHNSSHTSNVLNNSNSSTGKGRIETKLDLSWISHGGLFTSGRDSPKSVRSDKMRFPTKQGKNDSGSEADSIYTRRRAVDSPEDVKLPYHSNNFGYNRRESDNESEWSAMSRRRRRRYQRGYESGSDAESIQRRRYKRSQRCHKEEGSVCSATSTPASEMKHSKCSGRYHRDPVSKYPRDPVSKYPMSEELIKHLNFQLMGTNGLTGDQLKDITYTSVKLNDTLNSPVKDAMISPVSLRRTSSSSYENILYDKTGSARLAKDDEMATEYQSKHSAEYSIILPPPKFDSSPDKSCIHSQPGRQNVAQGKENYQSNTLTSNRRQSDHHYDRGPVNQQTPPSKLNKFRNSSATQHSPSAIPNKYSASSSMPSTDDNGTLERRSNGNSYRNSNGNTSANGNTNLNNSSPRKPPEKTCENANQNSRTLASPNRSQGQWIDSLNVYKHTDHAASPKVATTCNSKRISQQYSPVTHLYQHNYQTLNGNLPTAPFTGNRMHSAPLAKQQPVNGIPDSNLSDSFYAQYCDRKAKKVSSNGPKIANISSTSMKPLLKVSNI